MLTKLVKFDSKTEILTLKPQKLKKNWQILTLKSKFGQKKTPYFEIRAMKNNEQKKNRITQVQIYR